MDDHGRTALFELEIVHTAFDLRTCKVRPALTGAVQDEDVLPKLHLIPEPTRDQQLDDYIAYFQRMHQKAEEIAMAKGSDDAKSSTIPSATLLEITQFR